MTRTLAAFLFVAAVGSGGAFAQQHEQQPAEHPAAAASAAESAGHAVAAEPSGDAAHAEPGAAEHGPGEILMHHVTDQPLGVGILTKHMVFFLISTTLVFIVVRLALRSYDKRRVAKGLGAAVESIVVFIRDEVAEKNIGHDGIKYTPLLCSFFFFILFTALIGLIPILVPGRSGWEIFSATATGNIAVTMGLAVISFAAQQYAGISKYGLWGHLKNLVPPGLPVFIIPLMIVVEIIGVFTKPFALMVRLFANMLAGHMMVGALLLIIPLTAQVSPYLGFSMIPVSLGLALFIMILEVLVAFIQAYIFTLLTSIFIGMYAHPAH